MVRGFAKSQMVNYQFSSEGYNFVWSKNMKKAFLSTITINVPPLTGLILLIILFASCSPAPTPSPTTLPPPEIEFAWEYKAGDYIRSIPLIHESTLYLGSDDNSLHALDASTGEPLWSY